MMAWLFWLSQTMVIPSFPLPTVEREDQESDVGSHATRSFR